MFEKPARSGALWLVGASCFACLAGAHAQASSSWLPPPAADADGGTVPLALRQVVATALERHPALAAAEAARDSAAASLLSAQAPFDAAFVTTLGHDHDTRAELPGRSVSDATRWELGVAKTFTTGTRVAAGVSLERLDTRFSPDTGLASSAIQRATPSLSVTQPLLRGAGTLGAASAIDAAEALHVAADLSRSHTAQSQVYAAISAYYGLVLADQELALFRASQHRAEQLLVEIRTAVEADQRPRSDLRQLEGTVADRARSVFDGEGARTQALHTLQLAMGIRLDESRNWSPSESFPPIVAPVTPLVALLERARKRRRDLQAAEASVRAAAAASRGADHNTLPALDLTVAVRYAGAQRDSQGVPLVGAAFDHVRGVSGGASIRLELPFENRAQRAQLALARAQLDSAEIARDDLLRNIQTDLASALDVVTLASRSLGAAREAERQYNQALTDERDKLLAQLSTVIDVVRTEDVLMQVQRIRVRTELAATLALWRLQLELGALPSRPAEPLPDPAGLAPRTAAETDAQEPAHAG